MENIGFYKTKLCTFKICESNGFITTIEFTDENCDIHSCNPSNLTDIVAGQLDEYLRGCRREFDFPIKLFGTDFQKKVWNVLKTIPYGKTVSYKDVAVAVGNPRACRAVGLANNKNPIAIAVPCHRVIGTNGKLTGYAGGLEIKEKLLKLEQGQLWLF